MSQLDAVTQQKIEWMIDSLCTEFGGRFPRDQIAAAMRDSAARLAETATVFDYLPLMAQRFTRERLQSAAVLVRTVPAPLRDVSRAVQAA